VHVGEVAKQRIVFSSVHLCVCV